jgi:hypothetical protein
MLSLLYMSMFFRGRPGMRYGAIDTGQRRFRNFGIDMGERSNATCLGESLESIMRVSKCGIWARQLNGVTLE